MSLPTILAGLFGIQGPGSLFIVEDTTGVVTLSQQDQYSAVTSSDNSNGRMYSDARGRATAEGALLITIRNSVTKRYLQISVDGYVVFDDAPFEWKIQLALGLGSLYNIVDPVSGHVITTSATAGALVRVAPLDATDPNQKLALLALRGLVPAPGA